MNNNRDPQSSSDNPNAAARKRRAAVAATTTAVLLSGAGLVYAVRGDHHSAANTQLDRTTTSAKPKQRPGSPYVCAVAGGDSVRIKIDHDMTLGDLAAGKSGELLSRLDPAFDPKTVGETAVGEACAAAWVDDIAQRNSFSVDEMRHGDPSLPLREGQTVTLPGNNLNNVQFGQQ